MRRYTVAAEFSTSDVVLMQATVKEAGGRA